MNDYTTKQDILEKITQGEVRQRSRTYFVLRGGLLIATILLALVTAGFLLSFVFFALRVSGVGLAPGVGFRGIPILLGGTPWLILLLVLVVYGVLEIMARRYAITYRRPLTVSLLVGLLLVVGIGSAIARTEFHDAMFARAGMGRLPIAGELYRGVERPLPEHVNMGVVTDVSEGTITISSAANEVLTATIDAKTKMPRHQGVQVNDHVVIFGEREGDRIQAFGVRLLGERGGLPHMRQPKKNPLEARLHHWR